MASLMKHQLDKIANGDMSTFKKIAQKGKVAAKGAIASAVTRTLKGDVDDRMQDVHDKISAMHASYNEIHAALKHQAERARKMAKGLRDAGTPMVDFAGLIGLDERRSIQAVVAVDAAIAARYEEYASMLETELLAPAKQECAPLFAEADALWSAYIATVNELAAKQALKSGASTTSVLNEKKASQESSMLPRLTALTEAAEKAICFLIERHRLLMFASMRDTLAKGAEAAGAAGAGGGGEEDAASARNSIRAGWAQLGQASGSAAFAAEHGGKGAVPPAPSQTRAHGVPLETLALRADAVDGIPLVARELLCVLYAGYDAVSASYFVDAEGLFRVQAEADECEVLRKQIDAGPSATVDAIRAVTDPHVLATSLKQWLRRLPSPLVPTAAYKRLVALGQQSQAHAADGGDAAPPQALLDDLSALTRSLPQPNLLTLHALVELLELVASRASLNRMSPSNLALVFAPTLCRGSEGAASMADGGMELAVEIPAAAQAIAVLISHRVQCFPALQSPFGAGSGGDSGRASTATEYEPVAAQGAVGAGGSAGGNSSTMWWYSACGEQVGPVTGAQLAAMLTSGEVSMSTWVFEDGTADWQELGRAQERLPRLSTL